VVAALALAAVAQVWIITAGAWTHWPQYTSHYAGLADGFLHGELSLHVRPSPELLALPDPYDPRANFPYRIHDLVLFQGKYYLSWGPVPALLTAGACLVMGIPTPSIGDQYLTFIFMEGMLLLIGILLLQLRSRLFPQQPVGIVVAAVLSLALGTPVLYTLARAAIYEASVAAGQFFLVAGLCAAWQGLCGVRPRPLWMCVAGLCWALSAGSRISMIPAVGALTLIALWQLCRGRPRAPWRALTGLVLPILAAAALMAWYNLARFHSVTEFGVRYQLAGRNQLELPRSDIFSLRFIIPNLYGYLLAPIYWENTFPYLWASVRNDSFLTGRHSWLAVHLHMPHYYAFEPLVGLVWSQPFLLLAAWALKRPRPIVRQEPHSPEHWITLSLGAAVVLGGFPALVIATSTMRYLLDAVPCCTILAVLGYWRILEHWDQRPILARGVRWIIAGLVLVQSVLGLLLAVSGYSDNFIVHNPELFLHLRAMLPTFNW
jgi:hypothetical protein